MERIRSQLREVKIRAPIEVGSGLESLSNFQSVLIQTRGFFLKGTVLRFYIWVHETVSSSGIRFTLSVVFQWSLRSIL